MAALKGPPYNSATSVCSDSRRWAVGTVGARECGRRDRAHGVKGLQRDGTCGEMRRKADASGKRNQCGVGMAARAAHHALGFALGGVMHRTDLTGSDTGTAFRLLLLVMRRRTARGHRRNAHGGQMARQPD